MGREADVRLGEMRVREARMRDVGTLVELSSALFREDAGTRDPFTNLEWPEQYGRTHFAGFVGRQDRMCLLAEAERVTVGYLAGYVRDCTAFRPVAVAELESMYVREGARRLGVGARLVVGFLAWAEVRGARRVSVTSYASNERAIRFYERRGFVPKSLTLEMGLG